ncbi:hypothetical protein AB0L34_12245 [Micromonospora sp. NPDC052213]|uniref:hypothetical protein n=1 Tax=Micromonospora sp. NPDC052213 TaxID=3155812 RepID=UPI00341CE6CB
MSPQRIYNRANMHTYESADCTACGQPNHVNWIPDHRLGVENFLPDESCDNRDCERYGKGPEKR